MNLHYNKHGKGNPIVILHGLFGSGNNWHTVGKKLAESHEVFLIDQRNHGKSPHSNEFNYQVMVKDIEEFFDDHNIECALLIGHSMGGKTAMNFALKNVNKVFGLIVVDIGIKDYPFSDTVLLNAMKNLNLNSIISREGADIELSKTIDNRRVRQFLLQNLKRAKSNKLEWKINLQCIIDNIGRIGEPVKPGNSFNKPALFISGSESDYIHEEDHSSILNIFPQARFMIIEKAGHWVHADNPDGFIKTARDFFG